MRCAPASSRSPTASGRGPSPASVSVEREPVSYTHLRAHETVAKKKRRATL
ncbi:hypothetical protein AERO_18290 [Aeromicrobium fastidiosum]|uniref:hypothetical protein n=1 Tax=Aeromicrobium fastidiosum TaxID=52699 RepID=UPI0020233344|nr:hypothetical protein [Aeromicrobium fastidiosum]MCL8253332.1 hypothetical protein [Aeromicrobium fastidiosum]